MLPMARGSSKKRPQDRHAEPCTPVSSPGMSLFTPSGGLRRQVLQRDPSMASPLSILYPGRRDKVDARIGEKLPMVSRQSHARAVWEPPHWPVAPACLVVTFPVEVPFISSPAKQQKGKDYRYTSFWPALDPCPSILTSVLVPRQHLETLNQPHHLLVLW